MKKYYEQYKKEGLYSVSGLLIIVLLYFVLFNPFWIDQNALFHQKVMDAFWNFHKVNSLSMNVKVDGDVKAWGYDLNEIYGWDKLSKDNLIEKIAFNSEVSFKEIEEQRKNFKLNIGLITSDINEQELKLNMELYVILQKLYFSISELEIPYLKTEELDKFKTFFNVFYSIDLPESRYSFAGPYRMNNLDQEEFYEIYKLYPFLSLNRKGGKDDIKGQLARKYKVDFSKDNFKLFQQEIIKKEGKIWTEEYESNFNLFVDSFDFEGAIWISEDNYIVKVYGDLDILWEQWSEDEVDFQMEIEFFNINSIDEIMAPENSVDFPMKGYLGLL